MRILASTLACLGLLVVAGCTQQSETPTGGAPSASPVDVSKFLLQEEPADAAEVIAARESVQDGDDIRIVGRIGGSENPWIEGRAAFSIVDNSLKACSDIPGDTCEVPWDYCCETDKLPAATALIKLVDENGKLVAGDARQWLPVKELSTVVVEGKAQRDDAGNLAVLASGVFVKP